MEKINNQLVLVKKKKDKILILNIIIIILGTIFISLGAFHTNIWFDESYSVAISNHSFSEIWNIGGNDVHPVFYYMLSLMVCNGPLGVSLLWILESIFQNTRSLNYSIFYFLLSFCLFCLVLSPDKVNKILPFELKTEKGFKKFVYLSVFLAAILLILMK